MNFQGVKDYLARNRLANALGRILMPSTVVDYRKDDRSLYIRIDVANTCNLRCRMCPSVGIMNRKDHTPHFMPLDLFHRIADMTFPYTKKLQLSCNFESLLHPKFKDILEITGEYGIPGSGFVTNAMLLSPEIAEATVKAGLTDVSVSIDSVDRDTFESIRRGAKFERVINNVREFVRVRNALDSHIPALRINHVMMTSTIHRIEEFCEMCIDLGAACIVFVHMQPYTKDNPEYCGSDPDLFAHYRERALEILEKAGIVYIMPTPFELEEGEQHTLGEHESRAMAAHCRSPWRLLQIQSTGDVFPCGPRALNPPFGNLADQSFDEIWNNLKFLWLRSNIRRGHPKTTCASCQAFFAPTFEDENL